VTDRQDGAGGEARVPDPPAPLQVGIPTSPMPVALVTHEDCGRHDTGWGHPEHMGRLPAIVKALYRDTPALLDHVLQHEARHATEAQLMRVHTAAHIERVRRAVAEATRSGELVHLEADTVVSPASWDAALAAAGCAIDAAALTLTGRARHALALSRPPGHHATQDRALGFCLFNNVAVAARAAQAEHGAERVLIIDWDVHHGNGTQDIFYGDASVYYLSLHIAGHYPGSGAAAERGAGAGLGHTLNVPLAAGTSAAEYRLAFDDALAQAFDGAAPGLILVSAGGDCLAGDPLGGLLLEPADLHAMATAVKRHAARIPAPVVAVLEGGYAPGRTGAGMVAVLRALAGLAL
jgi:acetoin utilization deacetylase AcuC-like enzyme